MKEEQTGMENLNVDRHWLSWCRLCAKEQLNEKFVLLNNEHQSTDPMLITAIGKYFWVNITADDKLPHSLCADCYELVAALMEFSKHVHKVQTMFYALMTADLCDYEKVKAMRYKNGINEDSWPFSMHIKHVLLDDKSQNDAIEWQEQEEEQEANHNGEDTTLELQVELENILSELDEDEHTNGEVEETKNNFDIDMPENNKNKDTTILLEESDTNEEFIATTNNENQSETTRNVRRSKRMLFAKDQNKSNEETSTTDFKYKCDVCSRKYKSLNCYKRHMLESHEKEPPLPELKCDECGKTYLTEKLLNMHLRTHLPPELKINVPCPHCDKKFSKVTVMRQHVNGQHLNQKPFICDECGKALKTMAALNEHKLVHTTECPFECTVCHKRFKNKARLKTHSDVHAEVSYSCSVCGMQLNTRRTLKMHMLVHSEEKQYKCNFCSQAFKRGKALKNHLILHTGIRPYKCTFCEKTFSNGSNCRAHKKKMHPLELAKEEAEGIKTSNTVVPRLEELRSSTNIKQTRKETRTFGGLPMRLQDFINNAESPKKRKLSCNIVKFNEGDPLHITFDNSVHSDDEILVAAEQDDDEDNGSTIVYELVHDD